LQTAWIDASEMRFPPVCIRCGESANAAHEVTVSRGIDLIFVAYWHFIAVPIPVCRPCRRHRKVVGALCWTGLPLTILVGGFLAFILADSGRSVAAAAMGVVIGAIALLGRFRLDDLVEWMTLGVRLVWRKGAGIPLRVRFRRAEYFSAWAAVNPRATLDLAAPLSPDRRGADKPLEPAPSRRYEVPTMSTAQLFDRKIPVLTLLGLTVCLALHHWYAVTQHEVYFVALFLLPMFWMLALGGTFYPPILYSIGKYGRDLPMATKIAGGLIALSGLGLGFCLAKFAYGMF
jgi:hypothetical protein